MVDLDTIFRSIINFKSSKGQETIPQKDLLKNFRSLQQIVPDPPEEKAYTILYHFILDYIKNCEGGEPQLPSYEFIKQHFEEVEGSEVVLVILEKIKTQTPYLGQDYRTILKSYNIDQDTRKLERILTTTNKIATVGVEIGTGIKKVLLKGIADGISYFARETRALQRSLFGIKTESQIVSIEDAEEVEKEYDKAKENPTFSLGVKTWLHQIDDATGGLKNTELMIVAAAPGHCKTTFALNMLYRALWGGYNTGFVTLEMGFDEIRRHLYCLHSCNPKFREMMPEYADLVGNLHYNDIWFGKLRPEEEPYWKVVIRDMNKAFNEKAEKYGRVFVWQPEKTNTTTSDIDLKMRQWQQGLQATDRGDLELLIIDYISLMGADKDQKTTDHNETLNNIIKSLKRICLTFNNGKGTRILSPFQMNRTGYREALANEGKYFMTALSNAHEAERSADIVISLFKRNELDSKNGLRICCLKNRRNAVFNPFDACVNFENRFIYNERDEVEYAKNIEMIHGTI